MAFASLQQWLRRQSVVSPTAGRPRQRPRPSWRPRLEALEDRLVPTTFSVLNLNDAGAGSLRQAVLDANAAAGADIINFQAGLSGTITLTQGELAITDAVTINGPGAGSLTVSGNNASRVFEFYSGTSFLSGLTLTGGLSQGFQDGGAIANNGNLTLTNCTLSGNSAGHSGGGIANSTGTLTLTNCTLSGNSSPGIAQVGGGIYNSTGTLTLTNCTLSGNSADGIHGGSGGGIYNYNGPVTLTNCTLSGNSSSGGSSAGGIDNHFGTLTLNNTIVANSPRGLDIRGSYSGSNNLFGSVALGPLQNNGGPTPTLALPPGSPARDVGDNSFAPATDQRGFSRIVHGTVDIGAFEVQSTATVTAAPTASTYGQNVSLTAMLVQNGNPVSAGTVTFKDGPITLASGVVLNSSGQATFSLTTLSVGTHPISVVYSGASGFDASSGTTNVTVSPASTTTTVAASPLAPVYYGQTVTLTATVVQNGNPVSAGTVTFKDGSTILVSSVILNGSGQASFSLTTLSAGAHTITAGYNGTTNFNPSFGSTSMTVTPAPLTIMPTANQSKVYGAAVPALAYAASGFVNGDGPALLTGSLATTATAASPVGPYAFTLGTLGAGVNYALALAANPPTFAVTPASLTVTANNASKVYAQANPVFAAGYSGFVNGDTASSLGGALNFSTPATASSPVGSYAVTPAGLTSGNYALSYVNGTLTVNPMALTVTANNTTRNYGVANPTFTASYSGFVNGDTASVLSGSPSLTTTATASSAPNSYPITAGPGSLAAANYSFACVNSMLTVTAASLPATGVSFSATAGAPFSGVVASFTNADPYGNAAAYIALITWGDGTQSAGVLSGSGSPFTVSGSHTYADPVNKTVVVMISHTLGYTTTATTSGTAATVTSLGQGVQAGLAGGIGFWHNNNGQALINSFNGGANSTALSAWLAATFPNLYGASAGANNNLAGKTNSQVAAFYQAQFGLSGPKVEAETLAVALNVYATTLSLGGTAGQANGFTVSATGLGARSFNVGNNGAAFGVANNTTLNVYQLLLAVNQRAVNGVLYNGDATLRQQANDLFDALNQAGGIG